MSWLEKVVLLAEDLGKLKDDKISDQETIIDLQTKVIEKQEDSVRSVLSSDHGRHGDEELCFNCLRVAQICSHQSGFKLLS